MRKSDTSIDPLKLGYFTFLLPVLTFHICWLVSMAEGVFDPCVPYWADCVSISHTGRHGLSYFLFKGGIVPTAVLLVIFWQLNRSWLVSLGCPNHKLFLLLALTGSGALLAYSLALGHSGDSFRLVRRFGVVLFMFCTFVGQVLLGQALASRAERAINRGGKRLLQLSAFTLGVAIFSLILDAALGDTYDRVEDAFEWWLIMLLLGHLFLVVRLWGETNFQLEPGIKSTS